MSDLSQDEGANTEERDTHPIKLSRQGEQLVRLYKDMAEQGYQRITGSTVTGDKVYNDFELIKFRNIVRPLLSRSDIKTVLDYGSGGSDWDAKGFEPSTNESAKEFFMLDEVQSFEPARALTEKTTADCVVCVDVLEHIFLADVPKVVNELFSLAKKMLIINVACYPAAAMLPNGENAHITVREPLWWKGVIDSISIEYPDIEVLLICSETFVNGIVFPAIKSRLWLESKQFKIDQNIIEFGEKPQASKNITLSPEQVLNLTDMLVKERPEFVPQIEAIVGNNNLVSNNSLNLDLEQSAGV